MITDNLILLREKKLSLYHQLRNSEPDSEGYKLALSRVDSLPTIEKYTEGRWSPLHSKFNPVEEASRWADTTLFQEDKTPTNLVLFGFGLGYHALEILRRDPNIKLHIFEPDRNLVLYSLQKIDWKKFNLGRIETFAIAEDSKATIENFVESLLGKIDENWKFSAIPSYQRVFKNEYEFFAEQLTLKKENYLQGLKTTAVLEKNWSLNALKNLKSVYSTPSIYHYKDYFKDQTVIMTASGPSLEQAISLIMEAKKLNKALVIAAGTSVNSLLKLGVAPDLFVSYDPSKANFEALSASLGAGIPLVYGSSIYHEVINKHCGDKAQFILSQDPYYPALNKAFNRNEMIMDAPTVSAVTLQLLAKLGVKKVILAGQDLAYINDKYYSAGNANLRSESVTEADLRGSVEVDNNSGGKSPSSKAFIRMKESIETVIEAFPNLEVHNLSSKGAKIKGSSYLDLEAAWGLVEDSQVPTVAFEPINEKAKKFDKDVLFIEEKLKYYNTAFAQLDDLISSMIDDYRSGRQLKKHFIDIDQCLEDITARKDFNFLIRPFVRLRIELATRAIQKIRANNVGQDLYDKEAELYDYYTNKIGSFVFELKEVLKYYNEFLDK